MTPFKEVQSRPIKPYNFYTYTPDSENLLVAFWGDKQSFLFLHYLIRYCCEKNQGEWPDQITPEIIAAMSKDAKTQICVEGMKAFKNGYVTKVGNNYELTHEFVAGSFIFGSDGNFIPISTGHLDFSKGEKLAEFLKNGLHISLPEVVTFLVKLFEDFSKKPGVLFDRVTDFERLLQIAVKNHLSPETCITISEKSGYIDTEDTDNVTLNGLVLAAYYAMPKLI